MPKGTFPIWIGYTRDEGAALIGARAIDEAGGVRAERVYASQLRHRVVVQTEDGYRVCTPTEAKRQGWYIVDWFA